MRGKREAQGLQAAFGDRRRVQASARFQAYRGLKVAGRRPGRAFPDYLEFYPTARDAAEFTDLSARVNCYFGDAGLPLWIPGHRHELDPGLAPWFEPSLVRDPGWSDERPAGDGWLVIHRLSPGALRRMAASRAPVKVVDHRLHAYSEMEYFSLRNEATWPTYAPVEAALERLGGLSNGGGTAFILATGPSALTVDLEAVDADVRITCNSAVRNMEQIRRYRPNVIAFTDPVFHFGPSRYAAEFRRDMLRAVEEVDALVLCGHDFAAPLLGLVPELEHRLCVMPTQRGGPFRWPTPRNPTVRLATSVLTNLMLPVALMLADHVQIAGADGRQPQERYFWSHNPSLQYDAGLMQTVFDAHPAFFRDRDYADYYDQHCADIEALISIGEQAGKIVRAASPSWIPALRERGAPEPAALAAQPA